jgi:hypothetical protein
LAERVKGLPGRRSPNGAGRPLTPAVAECGTLDRLNNRVLTQEAMTPTHRERWKEILEVAAARAADGNSVVGYRPADVTVPRARMTGARRDAARWPIYPTASPVRTAGRAGCDGHLAMHCAAPGTLVCSARHGYG